MNKVCENCKYQELHKDEDPCISCYDNKNWLYWAKNPISLNEVRFYASGLILGFISGGLFGIILGTILKTVIK